MVCLPVVNDLFLLIFGLVGLLKTFLLLHLLLVLENLEVYWDTFSWLQLPRNLFVESYPWHKSVLVSNPSKFERASQLVRKVFTSSRCYPHGYLLNAESTLMAWFWRVFILLLAQWRSNTWVFGLQVMITGWSLKVRLGFDTSMLNVSWLVRRLASVGGVKRASSNVSETLELRLGDSS
jgi:hypothetical protein